MRWHWSGVIRLIATIVGLGVGILDKFVLGSGWIPAIGLTILVFLAIPFITGLVWEAVERLMAWREIKPHSGTLDGLAPRDTGGRPMTPPRRFPPPWHVVELPGGYAHCPRPSGSTFKMTMPSRRRSKARLLPGHGFQQPETHVPLPSNSMVRSLIAR